MLHNSPYVHRDRVEENRSDEENKTKITTTIMGLCRRRIGTISELR